MPEGSIIMTADFTCRTGVLGVAAQIAAPVGLPARSLRCKNYPADVRNPYLVVSNHQSLADIPILSRLPWDMKWVGKKSLFDLPVLGWMMFLARDIPVDRTNRRSRAQVFLESRDRLENKVSVIIFPEGTRVKSGDIRSFESGTSMIALKNKAPVIPVYIKGNYKLFCRMTVIIGEPVLLSDHFGTATNTQTVSKATEFLQNKLKDLKEAKI